MSGETTRRVQIEGLISEILNLESNVSHIDEELAQIVAVRSSVQQEIAALEAEAAACRDGRRIFRACRHRLVAEQSVEDTAASQIPELDDAVVASRQQMAAGRIEADTVDSAIMRIVVL